MKTRPRIKIELTTTDKFVEIIGWCALLAIWIMSIIGYSKLPDIIPIHYNFTGEANAFGGKINILLLPVIATILFVGLTLVNKYPHIFNYPTKITEENALRQYTIATRLVRYMKLFVVLIFGFIVFTIIQNANELNTLVLPVALGFTVLLLLYFIIKMYKAK